LEQTESDKVPRICQINSHTAIDGGQSISTLTAVAERHTRRPHMHHSVAIRAARINDFPAICSINGQSLPAVSLLAPGDLDRVTALATVVWVAVVDEVVSGYLLG
jgi:hypothetical protein